MDLTKNELLKLKSSKTSLEWENIVKEIKKTRDGNLPTDWAEKVIAGNFVNPKMRDGISIW